MKSIIPVLLLFCFSCVSTRHHVSSFSPEKISTTDKILVAKIPGAYHYENFKQLRKKSTKNDLTIFYQPEIEWDLRALGVLNPLDPQYFSLLKQNGYDYLIIFDNLIEKQGDLYSFYTDRELNDPHSVNFADGSEHSSSVNLFVISLDSKKLIYKNSIETNLGAFISKDKDAEHHINVMAVENVTEKAIIKGYKKMLRDLYVN